MIAILDYGVGNLFSLSGSLKALGLEAEITGDPDRLQAADRIILPGVGAFGDARAKLEEAGLVPVLKKRQRKSLFLESVWECSSFLIRVWNMEFIKVLD